MKLLLSRILATCISLASASQVSPGTNQSSLYCNESTEPQQQNEFKELLSILDEAIIGFSGEASLSLSQPPVKGFGHNNCSLIFMYIQNQAAYIAKQANLLKLVKVSDEDLFSTLKDEYLKDLQILITTVDQLLQKYSSVSTQEASGDFTSNLRSIQRKIVELDFFLSGIADQYTNPKVGRCLVFFKLEDFDAAINELESIANSAEVREVVEAIYDRSIFNFNKLIEFTQNLENSTMKSLIYSELYNQMASNSNQNTFKILLLDSLVRDAITADLSDSLAKTNLQKLELKLNPSVNYFLEYCAAEILKGNTDDILSFFKKHPDVFQFHMALLIDKVYAQNLKNTNRILTFVAKATTKLVKKPMSGSRYDFRRNQISTWTGWQMVPEVQLENNLESPKLQSSAYFQLYKVMERNGHFSNGSALVNLACRVKGQLSTNPQEGNLIIIKNQLPEVMRKLLWNGEVIIESNFRKNYTLFPSDTYGDILAYPEGDYYNKNVQKWEVENEEDGNGDCYFKFVSKVIGNALSRFPYFDIDKAVSSPSQEWTPGRIPDSQYWKVVPVDDDKSVYFQNKAISSGLLNIGNIKPYTAAAGRECCCRNVGVDYNRTHMIEENNKWIIK